MPMMGPGGVPFPMGAVPGGAYDPHERMDMRPMGGMVPGRAPNARPSVLPRTDDRDVPMGQNPGELPVIQDLTPQVPIQDVSPHNNGEGFRQQQQPRPPIEVAPPPMDSPSRDLPPHLTLSGGGPPQRPFTNGRGGGRGRGRGTFGGDAQSFRPERRNDKTLVVEKIPEDKLSLGSVNDWFSKFGTVTNVAVDAASSKALVSFSDHEEAHKAWKSEEAVFGNRFVKVFWHRPMEGHGQAGQRMLAASAPMVAQRSPAPAPSAAPHEGSPAPHSQTTAAAPSRSASASTSAAATLAAKQKLLQQQIEEQKALMGKLSSASPEEKKEIMARLRKLGEEMKKPSVTPAASTSSPPPAAASSTPAKRSAPSTPLPDEHERLERERLDKELEMHHVETGGEGEEESTEELKAKLERLKAEVRHCSVVASRSMTLLTLLRPCICRQRAWASPSRETAPPTRAAAHTGRTVGEGVARVVRSTVAPCVVGPHGRA